MTELVQQRFGSKSGWPVQPAGRVPLLDVDPDLAGRSARADGAARLTVPVFRFSTGRLPAAPEPDGDSRLGYLVLKGLLLYESAVCGRSAAELLGPGDVVRPAGHYQSGTLTTQATWTVLETTLLGDLAAVEASRSDNKVAVLESLAARCEDRAERIAIERSIGSHVRVDVRVLAYLWHLADRFGHVVPDGVRLDLPLTHAVLARLVGARRPTVTTALQRLIQLNYLARDGRTFRLIGDGSLVDDLDRRSPARDFAYPDGSMDGNSSNGSIDGNSPDGSMDGNSSNGFALN